MLLLHLSPKSEWASLHFVHQKSQAVARRREVLEDH